MQKIPHHREPSNLTSLISRVDPLSLRVIATYIEAGRRGRKIDFLVHQAMAEHHLALQGWRYGRAGEHLAIEIRRRLAKPRLIHGVPRYSTSKDALDGIVRLLLPQASITSSFGAGRSRIVAETTYANTRGEAYMTKATVPASNDPAAEAAARCGAVLRLVADMAVERRRFADEQSEDRGRAPKKRNPRS